ncbi:MAG TPA: type II toxin-antitoxin system VapC family toxin [Thermoanaerobaculia bacterium]|nr:type II toxin-antitoxin system VapC family toxin [Thermoanaerobaculia bacterium]
MMYALDANSIVYYFKGMGRVAERLLQTPPREIALPVVVLYELEVGIAKSLSPERRRAQLDELAAQVQLLPLGLAEARTAARIRADLERAGQPIGPLDNLIAGIALTHGATLVTHNVKEFRRIARLAVEDWF